MKDLLSPRDIPRLSEADIAELQQRLLEAEETLDAIRNGEVDAVVIGGPQERVVYTLEGADKPYRILVEQMQEGAVSLSEDGIVLYANQRIAGLLDVKRESLIGHQLSDFLLPHEGAAFDQLLKGGRDFGRSAEFDLLATSGARVPVNISVANLDTDVEPARVLCAVITDLTNSRRRSHELTAANQRLASEINERRRVEDSLQLALDAADMGYWSLNLRSGAIDYSPRYAEIFGFEHHSRGEHFESILAQFVEEDRAEVSRVFADAEGTGGVHLEKRITRGSDNAVRWVQIKARTHYQDGRAVSIAGVVSDVTHRRQIEEQLRQSQKMEAIGQLTGGIAHDFNNLLMVIGGSLDMLDLRAEKDARMNRLLTAARHGVERGAKLTQQLLAFSRRQDLRAEAVCIDDLIATFRNLLDRAIGETVELTIEPAPQRWFCRTDPHQLETAILNLAINACDAMPRGGHLRIATKVERVDGVMASLYDATPGDYVCVSVSDTGVGMTPELITRVFEPFFTTKDVGKGTGLGLSQVYGFARQSGGFANIRSEPDQGTTVSIHLPRTIAPDTKEDVPHLEVEQGGYGLILVVEDDDDVRAVTCSLLQDLGYSVLEADSGRHALDIIESHQDIILVFTDVVMSGDMNGIDLARAIKARRIGVPVLLTSGYTALRLVSDATLEGLQFLRKPFSQNELSIAVRATLEV